MPSDAGRVLYEIVHSNHPVDLFKPDANQLCETRKGLWEDCTQQWQDQVRALVLRLKFQVKYCCGHIHFWAIFQFDISSHSRIGSNSVHNIVLHRQIQFDVHIPARLRITGPFAQDSRKKLVLCSHNVPAGDDYNWGPQGWTLVRESTRLLLQFCHNPANHLDNYLWVYAQTLGRSGDWAWESARAPTKQNLGGFHQRNDYVRTSIKYFTSSKWWGLRWCIRSSEIDHSSKVSFF